MNKYSIFLIYFLLIPIYLNAQNCNPSKIDISLKAVCSELVKYKKSEISNNADLAKKMIFDDCGMNSVIIYEKEPPYTVIAYPIKPFEENNLKLISLNMRSLDNPFIQLTKQATADKIAVINIENFPNGYFNFNRTIWGLNCKTVDNEVVIVADSQIMFAPNSFMGSHILSLSSSILNDASLQIILDPTVNKDKRNDEIIKFSAKMLEASYEKTASALKISSDELKPVLKERIKTKEYLDNVFPTISDKSEKAGRAFVGKVISDLEKTIGGAIEIKYPKFKKIQEIESKVQGMSEVLNEIDKINKKLNELTKQPKPEIKSNTFLGYDLSLVLSVFSLFLSLTLFFIIFFK